MSGETEGQVTVELANMPTNVRVALAVASILIAHVQTLVGGAPASFMSNCLSNCSTSSARTAGCSEM